MIEKIKRKERLKRLKSEDPYNFYLSDDWEYIRDLTRKLYGKKCMKCRSVDTIKHVDHIRPRSLYPDLELNIRNLQILCKECNEEKCNNYIEDFRTVEEKKKLEMYIYKNKKNLEKFL